MTGTLCLVEANRSPGNTADYVRVAATLGLSTTILSSDRSSVAGLDLFGTPEPYVVVTDTKDPAEVIGAIRSRCAPDVVGVTSAHDFYAPIAAEAARALGLPGPDPAAVWACRRKDVVRDRLAEAGVAQPEYQWCEGPEEAVVAARRIGFPVIVKPVALADSIGVERCETAEEVAGHVRSLTSSAQFSTRRPVPGDLRSRVLVEAFIEGREFAVEVLDGRAIGVTETSFGPPPGFVEHQHVMTDSVSTDPAVGGALRTAAERASIALGLIRGPAHIEFRLLESTPAVIEINPRLAGGRIPELYQRTTGLDLWRAAIASCLVGQPAPVVVPPVTGAGVLRHLRLAHGESEPADVTRLGWSSPDCYVHLMRNGSLRGRPKRTSDSVGWAIATGPDATACNRKLDDVFRQLDEQVRLWPPPPR